jgi:hypothetical protein
VSRYEKGARGGAHEAGKEHVVREMEHCAPRTEHA